MQSAKRDTQRPCKFWAQFILRVAKINSASLAAVAVLLQRWQTSGMANQPPPQPPTEPAAVWVPLAALKPWGKNPRNNAKAVGKVAASIKRFGFGAPLLARPESGEVIAGHTRLLAAAKLGLATVPVRWMPGLTDAEAHALALADNRMGEIAEWDDAALAEVLRELQAADESLLADTGFTDDDLARLLEPHSGPTVGDDDVPEPRKTAVSVVGEVYQLGPHRLMCGDSTSAADVALLMDGNRAGMMETDPPYGVSYANDDRPNPGVAKPRVAKPRVANDGLADAALQAFLESAFRAAKDVALLPNAAWYLWHAHLTQGYFAAAAAAAAAVVLHRQIIWVKPVLLLGRGQYHWKHEPCFMGWIKGHQPPDYGLGKGERTQTTVWEVAGVTQADRKEFDHATPKPVALFTGPMVKHLRANEIAYEPFAGSGPQIIAAAVTGRRCFAMELDPVFVDVIRRRWTRWAIANNRDPGSGALDG